MMRKMRMTRRVNVFKKVISAIAVSALATAMLTGCGASSSTSTGSGQEKKVYKVGVTQISDHPSLDNCRKGFIEGLKNEGFVEGQNLEIEFVGAQDDMAKNTQIARTLQTQARIWYAA